MCRLVYPHRQHGIPPDSVLATSRVLAHRDVAPALCEALKNVFNEAGATLGRSPLDHSTMLGPIVDKLQFDRIMSYIEIGKKTATLVTGGERKGDEGLFVKPTIFLNPNP